MNHPHFSLTVNVDITHFLQFIKEENQAFHPAMVWAVSHAANNVPQLKQRIRGEEVVEHDWVHPSFAVNTDESDVFSFCEVKYAESYADFMEAAALKIEQMRTNPSFEDDHERDDYLFLSTIPWVSFTAIEHAMSYHPHDSVPRITWGKYFLEQQKWKMPLSVQAHHALVDGRHMGRFYQLFEAFCDQPKASL